MENWVSKHQVVGDIKVGQKVEVTFKTTPDIKEVVFVRHDCSCTTGLFDKEKGSIVVKYTGRIPNHLKKLYRHSVTKGITVSYKDGSSDYLSFTVTVVK